MRYETDLTDEQWELVEPFVRQGPGAGAKTTGGDTRGAQRTFLPEPHRLSVATVAQRLSSTLNGALLL